MSLHSSNERLNDFLVEIYRSLVQYASEAWPWSTDGAGDLRAAVEEVAVIQREDVSRLVHFLMSRGHVIDYGMYPHEFTSLHYVSLEYLYQQLVESQRALVRELEQSGGDFLGDADARQLTQQLAGSERTGLERLQKTTLPGGAAAPAWMK